MNKLTRIQAETLIRRAWHEVEKHTLGSFRFGATLWQLIPAEVLGQYANSDLSWPKDIDFFYETSENVVLQKFYYYFVEEK